MKVLIVDNNDSFTYNLKQLLENSGQCTYEIIKSDILKLSEVLLFDKVIISPGPGLPSDIPLLKKIILQYHSRIPVLGVCLGFQAIVEAFGGLIYNMKEPNHGIMKTISFSSEELIYKDIPHNTEVGLYHSWAASYEKFPSELEITSRSRDGVIMSVKHKNSSLRGIQFHPESIITKNGQMMINNWLRYA